MNVRGETCITLTDVQTGEVEEIKEENMITQAVVNLFSNNIEGLLYRTADAEGLNWRGMHLPICPNAIGGILLFSDPLVEEANNFYAPSENLCIGYASNDVNATPNVMRGSLNLNESGPITRGYKFVWDFATSQANGTISALALTHKRGGIAYWGDMYESHQRISCMRSIRGAETKLELDRRVWYCRAAEVNFEENYFIAIGMNKANEILIRKIRKCFREVGLNFSLACDGDEVLEEHTVIPTTFISSHAANGYGYENFVDGEDGYWYGFMTTGNSSGSATVLWIRIKKEDFSFIEGTWNLENTLLRGFGQTNCCDYSMTRFVQCVIRSGYVYLMHYARTGVYKIKLDNPADNTFIEFGFTSTFDTANSSCYLYMWKWGNWIMGSDFLLTEDDRVIHTKSYNPFNYSCTPVFQNGVYAITFGYYSSYEYVYTNLWLGLPYLASINNLTNSVVKTADKTMKITYTLTEV